MPLVTSVCEDFLVDETLWVKLDFAVKNAKILKIVDKIVIINAGHMRK